MMCSMACSSFLASLFCPSHIDKEDAGHMLLSVVMQNHFRQLSELLDGSSYDVNTTFGRAKRTLLHSAAR